MTTSLTKQQLKNQVLEELRNTRFPKRRNCRPNAALPDEPIESFALGVAPYRGNVEQKGRLHGPSKWNRKFPRLYKLLRKFIAVCHPDFEYSTIQLNKNFQCLPHVDKYNKGSSYIIALGDFTGGELIVEGKAYNIRNRWKKFDGRKEHSVAPFDGERYSLVFFTHTRSDM
jgi:hypothetical protein